MLIDESNIVEYQSLKLIADSIDAIIYVSDMKSFEILYMNEYAKSILGNHIGVLCWKVMQPCLTTECSFCSNNKLIDNKGFPTNVYISEYQNASSQRWYESHSQAIKWTNGTYVRLDVQYDISKRKKDEKKLFKLLNQQTLVSNISNNFNIRKEFPEKINTALKLLGEHLDISELYVIEKPNNNHAIVSAQWKHEACTSPVFSRNVVSVELWDFFIRKTDSKFTVKIDQESSDFPPSRFIDNFNLLYCSALIAPVLMNEGICGFIVAIDKIRFKQWLSYEINLVKTLSSIFSLAYERNFFEQAIINNEKRLSEANASKDKFFSIIAHDLKNPIYNLTSLSEFLMDNYDQWDDLKRKEFVKYIFESSKQGFNLLENLLEWSRSQTGKITVNPTLFDLTDLVNENIELAKASAKNKEIDLINTLSGEIRVFADYNTINTIVRNLISNALKFTHHGGFVKTRLTDSVNYFVFSIEDSGVGISEEIQQKLFKIDVNHSTPGTADESGTGLGLILCKEFIEKNNGKIWVESREGMGTKFFITIPKVKSNDQA